MNKKLPPDAGGKPVRHASFNLTVVLIALVISVHAQPVPLKVLAPGSKNFTTANGFLYYSSGDSLWKSNGTPAGTTFVTATGGEPFVLISNITVGSSFFFVTQTGAQQSLWKSDGTAANTLKVATHNSILPLLVYNGELILRINDGISGSELWKLNAANTVSIVKDVNPGSGDGFFGNLITSDNMLYFIGYAGSPPGPAGIWKSDGTTAGTLLAVTPPNNGLSYYSYGNLTDVDGTIFFSRNRPDTIDYYEDRSELWKTDGTQAGTVVVKSFEPDNSSSYDHLSRLIAMDGKLYFIRNYDAPQHDLYVSDGTEGGTLLVKNVGFDGGVEQMITLNHHIVLTDQTQTFPGYIQVSDGTTAGTFNLHSLGSMSLSTPLTWVNLTGAGNLLFYVDHSVNNEYYYNDRELWQSDLTPGNTKTLKEMFGISVSGTDNVRAAGENIFFTTPKPGQALQLWYYDPTPPVLCAGAGGIFREVWTGVTGQSVSKIPINTSPSSSEIRTSFAGPMNAGDNYGSRYRGYLCVQETGAYTFYIASDDHSELWLSTSADPSAKVKIAYVTGYTTPGKYDKYPSQKSQPINLVAGHRYYIEALHKEGLGKDHLSVAMDRPDGTKENPIQGSSLIPYESLMPAPAVELIALTQNEVTPSISDVTVEATASMKDGSIARVEFYSGDTYIGEDDSAPYALNWMNVPEGTYTLTAKAFDSRGIVTTSPSRTLTVSAEVKNAVSLSPNPAKAGPVILTLRGYSNLPGSGSVDVQVISTTGAVVYSKLVPCEEGCQDITLDLGSNMAPGVYILHGVTSGKRFAERLVIH